MSFHLLRPEWLFMIIPLLVLAAMYWRRILFSKNWESVIDPVLLPHLLSNKRGQRKALPLIGWMFVSVLVLFALAGPVWKKIPLPVFKQQSALIIALDLSNSMNATDIKPSRLARARLKLIDLLKARKEGQTALIAYAATAYTVTPLTDDTDTIQSLVSSLTTEIMPSQGSRADLAIQKSLNLFENAGLYRGDILLITDGVNSDILQKIGNIDMHGFRLSVLSVGTEQGVPIPVPSGGFIKDNKGSIVITRMDKGRLRQLASSLGGVYSTMSLDDRDIHQLEELLNTGPLSAEHEQTDFRADRWREEGPWLLLLVMPLAALAFRKGFILPLFLIIFILPVPRSVDAAEWSWDRFWRNNNQLGQQALEQGDAANAAVLFDQPDWKAAAFYRAGQYEQALQQLKSLESIDALYNRGNTLARMGELQQALESYEMALQQNPQHEDAVYNRDLVNKAMEQQSKDQQSKDQQSKDQQSKDQQSKDQQSKDQQSKDQQSKDQQSKDQQSKDQQNKDQQNKDQQNKDQQNKDQQKPQQREEPENAQKTEPDEKESAFDQEKQQDLLEQEEKLSQQAEQQWLRRIPDDPGGLLRNKFKYQYSREQQPNPEHEQW